MLSRVADSIYWMSRYVERAENVARFIDVNLQLMLDDPSGEGQQWAPLVNTTGDHAAFEPPVISGVTPPPKVGETQISGSSLFGSRRVKSICSPSGEI